MFSLMLISHSSTNYCEWLAKFLTLDELRDRKVTVLCNLKPMKMRGKRENIACESGRVLCASGVYMYDG